MDAQSLQCKVLKIISAVVNITSSTLVSNHSEKKKQRLKNSLGIDGEDTFFKGKLADNE